MFPWQAFPWAAFRSGAPLPPWYPPVPDGLRLHHIGQAVKEIPPAATLFARRFGYEIASPIMHDPLQTAFVQFLRLRNADHYHELVAPDNTASKLASVVRRGGGLHHLCYIAGPLEEEIAALQVEGMRLISDPKAAIAFAGRRICWLMGDDQVPIELVERRHPADLCPPEE